MNFSIDLAAMDYSYPILQSVCNKLHVLFFSALQDYSAIDSLDTAENKKETEEGTDVYFEILTNWGNPKYLGLTEVCVKRCNSCNHEQNLMYCIPQWAL